MGQSGSHKVEGTLTQKSVGLADPEESWTLPTTFNKLDDPEEDDKINLLDLIKLRPG